jgi:S-formylglutathione hydrolase FrmB
VSEAQRDANGILVHTVESALQAGPTQIRVLLPDRLEKDKRYPVVYVLPVEAGNGSQFGDGLLEVKKLDLHNKYGVIVVAPTFAHLPCYADHPTNEKLRQETYFTTVVVPAVESRYPAVAEARGRLLLGFSKSGWGAFCLLLRHPDQFGRAAAWDAPLTMVRPQFGMNDIVGTQENFESYRLAALVEKQAKRLGPQPRLGIMGYASFREHHQSFHDQLVRLQVPHEYRDVRKPKHTWDAGWLAEAVEFLVGAGK